MTPTGTIKRFVKGVLASGIGQVVTILTQIVGVPLFFRFWGAELYGNWIVLSTLPNYLQISDLSFGASAGNAMTVMVAGGNRDDAKKVYQSTWVLVSMVCLAILVVSLLLVWTLPIEKMLPVQHLDHPMVALTTSLLIGQIIVSQQGGLFTAAYRCDGGFAIGQMAFNALRVAEFAVTVAVLVAHGGMAQLAGGVLITRTVGYCFIYAHTLKQVPWLRLGVAHLDWSVLKPTVGPAIAFNAFPLGQVMNLQGTVIVVGYLFGPVAVAAFTTARTLSRLVLQLSTALANSMWVELSRAFGENNLDLARTLHRRLCQFGVWACVSGSIVLAIFGPWFYGKWTQHKTPLNVPMFEILLVVVAVNSLWNCSYMVPISINRHQRIALEYLVVMTSGAFLAFVMGKALGIVGVALALLCAEIVMNVLMLRASLTLVSDSFGPFIRTVISPPIGYVYRRARSMR